MTGNGETRNSSTEVAEPPAVATVILTDPAGMLGTDTDICSAATTVLKAAVVPKRNERLLPSKCFPNSITLTPGGPRMGWN